MKRALILAFVIAALAYALDYAVLRLRANCTNSITVLRSYTVPLKTGRTEYTTPEQVEEQCVRSLLPHMGETPCWYLARHTQQQITIDTGSRKEFPH